MKKIYGIILIKREISNVLLSPTIMLVFYDHISLNNLKILKQSKEKIRIKEVDEPMCYIPPFRGTEKEMLSIVNEIQEKTTARSIQLGYNKTSTFSSKEVQKIKEDIFNYKKSLMRELIGKI